MRLRDTFLSPESGAVTDEHVDLVVCEEKLMSLRDISPGNMNLLLREMMHLTYYRCLWDEHDNKTSSTTGNVRIREVKPRFPDWTNRPRTTSRIFITKYLGR